MIPRLFQRLCVISGFIGFLFLAGCGSVTIPSTIDNTPPTVSSVKAGETTIEEEGSTVPVDSVLIVTFSEVMKDTTVTAATITLDDEDDGEVTGEVETQTDSDGARNKEFVFTPESDLTPALSYTLTIVGSADGDGVKDVMGNALADDVTYIFTAEE